MTLTKQSSGPVLGWRETDDGLTPFSVDSTGTETRAVWAPQDGSQRAFLSCPLKEVLYEGTRGPGKTDALLMRFASQVNQGWGSEWKGIVFRKTFPELSDIIDKAKRWFPLMFPGATYNESSHVWKFPQGETLRFSFFAVPADYWGHHGHSYTFIGWEELTTWADDKCFKSMFSCARSTKPGIPIWICSTTNPYGVGHNWVKARYRLPIQMGNVVGPIINDSLTRDGDLEPPRVAIHGHLYENKVLLFAQPDYLTNIKTAARNDQELAAWVHGNWDIVAGGMFDDIWDPTKHVVPNVPLDKIPRGWRLDRSYDHGQSAPFSVGWWAESNGEPLMYKGRVYGRCRGDVYRVAEWYGWRKGYPNEGVRMLSTSIARGILERESDWGISGRVLRGPADTNIFDDFEPGKSVAGDMEMIGVSWDRADKGPGSRKQGWEQMRKLMKAALDNERETPGLFVMARCSEGFIRTVPVLPRCDKDPDDVDTAVEDHVGDECRYKLRRKEREIYTGSF